MEGLQVPIIGQNLRHYRVVLMEIAPDDPTHMTEIEYRVNAEHVGVNNVGNLVIVKGGEPVAEFAPGKWRAWRRADYNFAEKDV